jgi:hypothetical protein
MRKQYHSRESNGKRLIWDVHRLVELSSTLPVRSVRLDSIAELDEPFWFDSVGDATCRAVADHAGLIAETDLRYPIILSADGRVMDGMHRVAKAYLEDRQSIDAVRFDRDPEPDFVDRDPDSLPYDE